jgi:NADH dehydrogenase
MNILITGSTGEIGQRLIDELTKIHHFVRTLIHQTPCPIQSYYVTKYRGDLLDLESLMKACNGIETIIHMAAVTHTRDKKKYYDVNVKGTGNLISAAEKMCGQHFIYLSTRAIGEEGGAYSHSKQLAENKVTACNMKWTIYRPSEVYTGGSNDAIGRLIEMVKKKSIIPVIGKGDYKLAPVYVDDVVNMIIKSFDNRRVYGKIYNLSGPDEMTYCEFINKIMQMNNVKRKIVHIPEGLAKLIIAICSKMNLTQITPDQIPRLLLEKSADISLAKEELRYAPVKLENGRFFSQT